MITFTMNSEGQLSNSLLTLVDVARAGNYPNAMLGPFEDHVLFAGGIIIDGKGEKRLADAFENKLKSQDVFYTREDKIGVEYYKERRW